jgi:predicted GH43/DUF377 family glycosyl hydrolase
MFDCPLRGAPVRWAENHLFNPAAIVAGDRIHLLFRAEDGRGDVVGGYTSRIGLASSADGLDFEVEPAPVLFPANDGQVGAEWFGGCEDPRIVEGPAGR